MSDDFIIYSYNGVAQFFSMLEQQTFPAFGQSCTELK
jgi:hypothetical protein